MLKSGDGVAGTIPVLAQRAASEGPRWTRAVGIIPPTPYSDSSLRPCLGQGASRRARVGRVRSLACLSILRGLSAGLGSSCRLRDTGQRGRINNMKAPLGKGVFLIAAPSLRDPNFRQTVVLLCEHGAQGALGVVVNRPTAMSVSEALPQVPILEGQRHTGRRP